MHLRSKILRLRSEQFYPGAGVLKMNGSGPAVYALTKRTISTYLRGECRRRLRLDRYANDRIRKEHGIPTKDVMRPGGLLPVLWTLS